MGQVDRLAMWRTLFEEEFDSKAYLYHYTNFESACRIIYGNSLKFASLSRTNDTVESKPKITTPDKADRDKLEKLLQKFSSINKSNIRLMCFSKDCKRTAAQKDVSICNTYDYTGRGFALPRMWAQYGDNHKGLCFIIDKEKMLKQLASTKSLSTRVLETGDVKYKPQYASYEISKKKIEDFCELFEESNSIDEYSFLKSDNEFIKYNYFQKDNGWEQENEYRILLYNDKESFLKNFKNYCVGVVVGEMIGDMETKIIDLLANNGFIIKKIKFNYGQITLEDINYTGFNIYE